MGKEFHGLFLPRGADADAHHMFKTSAPSNSIIQNKGMK